MSDAVIERFNRHFEAAGDDDCWNWTGSTTKGGYGVFCMSKDKHTTASRACYILFIGQLDENEVVCHTCDNPLCVNPSHLFKGTQMVNIQDMIKKGRKAPVRDMRGEKHPRTKLTNEEAVAIFNSTESARVLAEKYSVSKSTVYAIKSGRNYGSATINPREDIV